MIDILIWTSLVGLLTAGAALVAITVAVILYWDHIIGWFNQYSSSLEANPQKVAFTLAESMKSGDYKVVQGIFNKKTNELVTARRVTSSQMDEETRRIHADQKLAIYS